MVDPGPRRFFLIRGHLSAFCVFWGFSWLRNLCTDTKPLMSSLHNMILAYRSPCRTTMRSEQPAAMNVAVTSDVNLSESSFG